MNKSTVGFINPVLYQNPQVLNDSECPSAPTLAGMFYFTNTRNPVVNGSNPGCGTIGFKSVEGWDPATGLGTPNYPKMLELFLSLP